MKSIVVLACLLASDVTVAFQTAPSSFTGRATSVCSREELRTALSCPPTRSKSLGRSAMSMPPFLRKLGLRRKKDQEETKNVLVLDPSSDTPSSATNATLETNESTAVEEEQKMEPTESTAVEEEQKMSKGDKMMQQVKDAGVAGAISLALWELAFWAVSLPVCIFGYREVAGHWPDLTSAEDLQKLGAEAFAFVNFARFAVPLRVGLALSTTPWIEENIVEKFLKNKGEKEEEEPTGLDANGSSD